MLSEIEKYWSIVIGKIKKDRVSRTELYFKNDSMYTNVFKKYSSPRPICILNWHVSRDKIMIKVSLIKRNGGLSGISSMQNDRENHKTPGVKPGFAT